MSELAVERRGNETENATADHLHRGHHRTRGFVTHARGIKRRGRPKQLTNREKNETESQLASERKRRRLNNHSHTESRDPDPAPDREAWFSQRSTQPAHQNHHRRNQRYNHRR